MFSACRKVRKDKIHFTILISLITRIMKQKVLEKGMTPALVMGQAGGEALGA